MADLNNTLELKYKNIQMNSMLSKLTDTYDMEIVIEHLENVIDREIVSRKFNDTIEKFFKEVLEKCDEEVALKEINEVITLIEDIE